MLFNQRKSWSTWSTLFLAFMVLLAGMSSHGQDEIPLDDLKRLTGLYELTVPSKGCFVSRPYAHYYIRIRQEAGQRFFIDYLDSEQRLMGSFPLEVYDNFVGYVSPRDIREYSYFRTKTIDGKTIKKELTYAMNIRWDAAPSYKRTQKWFRITAYINSEEDSISYSYIDGAFFDYSHLSNGRRGCSTNFRTLIKQ
jgi:hypothetical protein